MTLVVARILGDRIAIASDTMLTEHGRPLPRQQGVIKSCMLPGDICVSFANSPQLAERDFNNFTANFPEGAGFSETISFFERSSQNTGNDYIIAFSRKPRLVKISNGQRINGAARTQWIGDQIAYERFREYEAKHRKGIESGRAVNVVLFMDELENSPASDLYSTMRHVAGDGSVPSVGGFVCVISNRDPGFRYSVFSDMLYDWPIGETDDFILQLTDQIDLGASGENAGYSIAQISSNFLGLNPVAFYLLKPKKLFLFHGAPYGLANACLVLNDIEPIDINDKLNESVGVDLQWRLTITSEPGGRSETAHRSSIQEGPNGIGLSFLCHASTFSN